jgi:hypothetical protein
MTSRLSKLRKAAGSRHFSLSVPPWPKKRNSFCKTARSAQTGFSRPPRRSVGTSKPHWLPLTPPPSMAEKDTLSKDTLKRISVDTARVLPHLKVGRAEIIDTEDPCIEDRRADLVASQHGDGRNFILHTESQSDNQVGIPKRMLRCRSEISTATRSTTSAHPSSTSAEPRSAWPMLFSKPGWATATAISACIRWTARPCSARTSRTPSVTSSGAQSGMSNTPSRNDCINTPPTTEADVANGCACWKCSPPAARSNRSLKRKRTCSAEPTKPTCPRIVLVCNEARNKPLERQLTRCFGPLSVEAQQRLMTANLDQLAHWPTSSFIHNRRLMCSSCNRVIGEMKHGAV